MLFFIVLLSSDNYNKSSHMKLARILDKKNSIDFIKHLKESQQSRHGERDTDWDQLNAKTKRGSDGVKTVSSTIVLFI